MKLPYVSVAPWRIWRWMLSNQWREERVGAFKNLPHVVPGRWGFYFLGLEIGSRNPRDPVGVWLKSRGLSDVQMAWIAVAVTVAVVLLGFYGLSRLWRWLS